MKKQTLRYKDGRKLTVTYVLVDLPIYFEKQVKRPEKGGWKCPVGSCSCGGTR